MFKIGAKMKLVRHDHYPQLIGLQGVIVVPDGPADGVSPLMGATEPLYQVSAPPRTVYAIPESWLSRG